MAVMFTTAHSTGLLQQVQGRYAGVHPARWNKRERDEQHRRAASRNAQGSGQADARVKIIRQHCADTRRLYRPLQLCPAAPKPQGKDAITGCGDERTQQLERAYRRGNEI